MACILAQFPRERRMQRGVWTGRGMKKYEKIFRKNLEIVLVEAGILTQETAEQLREEKIRTGHLTGDIVLDMGVATEQEIAREISKRFQLPYLDLKTYHIAKGVIDRIPPRILHKHQVVPVDEFGDTLAVTMSQCISMDGLREIQGSTPLELAFYVSKISDVRKALDELAPFDAKVVEEERKKKALSAQPGTWTDIFDTANKNVMKGLTGKRENPFGK